MKIKLTLLCFMLGLVLACDRDRQPENDAVTMEHVGDEMANEAMTPMSMTAAEKNMTDSSTLAQVMSDTDNINENQVQQPDAMPSQMAPLELAKASGCLACHSVERKIVGPAWQEVAARYRNETAIRNRLIDKVKKGGAGNWTEVAGGVPMPPYSPRVKDRDIERLVDFVLSLNK